jgi:WW domain
MSHENTPTASGLEQRAQGLMFKDPATGAPYYYHQVTQQTVWERPCDPDGALAHVKDATVTVHKYSSSSKSSSSSRSSSSLLGKFIKQLQLLSLSMSQQK